jgi:ABC-type sugar transport system, permease component
MIAKESIGNKAFSTVNIILQVLLAASILLPFIYILSVSISDPDLAIKGQIWLLPKGITLKAYKYVFDFPGFWNAYYNTIWYTTVATIIGIVVSIITSYPLSQKNLDGRNIFMIFLMITMYFSGGMIPTYLVIKTLHLVDTRWVMVVPGAVVVFYIIMMRTFFQAIPDSLIESAKIDGASHFVILLKVIIPLSKAVIAVIMLYYAVNNWNSYFSALIYLNNSKLFPVQIILQKVLISVQANRALEGMQTTERQTLGMGIRYGMIIITILPIVCVYPFLQKYFMKGVMIGAVKG